MGESERPTTSGAAGAFGARTAKSAQAAGQRLADALRAAAPIARQRAVGFGDWLARIGWGKFFLLSLLLLAFGGIASSLLFDHRPAIVVDNSDAGDRVNVEVTVSPEGIRITPPKPPSAPPAPIAPTVPTAPTAPAAPGATKETARPDSSGTRSGDSASRDAGGAPAVQFDRKGLRILSDKDGRQVAVTIDEKGIRIEDSASATAASGKQEPSVVIGPNALQDPEKAAEAVDAARSRIEEIVSDQVRRQVARRTRVYREESSDSFMGLVVLVIMTLIIIKVVLGSKRKAETRAQAASATAAEESLKRQLAEARLKMMQAQVEPHFLFNTLASVDYLIETDPARASTMQKNLMQYLRAALPQMREGSTTLGKELALCRAYLEILKVRMEDRLQFVITVPQGLASAQFPPMMLQTLVENSVKHGLEPKPEGGALTISADVANGSLRVTVADTGLGFVVGQTAGTGVGLSNVRERLAALYGAKAKLQVEANTPTGTIATIKVPYAYEEATTPAPGSGASAQPA